MASFHHMVTVQTVAEAKEHTIETNTPLAPESLPDTNTGNTTVPTRQVHADEGKLHRVKTVDFALEEKMNIYDTPSEESDTSPADRSPRLPWPKLIIPNLDNTPVIDTRPPRDTGWAAWTTLIAATIVSSFVCGFYLSFGVFQNYFASDPRFNHSNQSAWIGVLSSGVQFLAAPLMTYSCQHTSLPRVHYVWVGWLICVFSLIGAAFSNTIPSLIITQGLLFGIGISILDNPLMIIVNTWFLRRRGIAYGLIFAIGDILGVAWSFLANHLLHHYTLRTTFLIFAGIITLGSGPCMLLLKERGATHVFRRGSNISICKTPVEDLPFSSVGGNFDLIRRDTPPTVIRYFHRPIFYILTISNLAQAFAFYLPLIYLPSYTTDLGYTTTQATIVLAIANIAQVIGEIGFGRLSDKINVHLLIIISSSIAALSTFLLWGMAKTLPMLTAYAFMFGMTGAGFIALWARMGILFGERDAQMVYSFMCTGRGLGTVISGPVSAKLLRGEMRRGGYGGGKYMKVVVFVGVSMAVSAVMGLPGVAVACGQWRGRWLGRKRGVVVSDEGCEVERKEKGEL